MAKKCDVIGFETFLTEQEIDVLGFVKKDRIVKCYGVQKLSDFSFFIINVFAAKNLQN